MAQHAKFITEVLTPEGEIFNGEVEMISTRTEVGQIGIYANHTPVLSMLAPTELRLYQDDKDIIRFAQGEGYMQFADNRALILVEEALKPDELDLDSLSEKLKSAEDAYANAEEGSEAQRTALRNKRRWQAFIEIAKQVR